MIYVTLLVHDAYAANDWIAFTLLTLFILNYFKQFDICELLNINVTL